MVGVSTEIGQAFGVKGAIVVTSYQYGAYALLKAGGKVKCWGYNEYGMLGFGTESTNNLVPEYVLELSGATSVGMGYYNTCALLKTGQVKCWGNNGNSELGNNNLTVTSSRTPVSVYGLLNGGAQSLHVGGDFSCVIMKVNSEIKCWGEGTNGQLGNGAASTSSVPVTVVGIP